MSAKGLFISRFDPHIGEVRARSEVQKKLHQTEIEMEEITKKPGLSQKNSLRLLRLLGRRDTLRWVIGQGWLL